MTGRKHMDEAVFKLVIPAVDLISGNTICFTKTAIRYGRWST